MAEYPIPPWLNPQTDWGGMAMRRSALKAQIAESGQRLAQSQLQFNQQMEMRRMAMEAEQAAQERQLQQQAELAKHRIAVEQAYQQAQVGLAAAKLQQEDRKVDLDYMQAARQFAGEQEFEDTLTKNLRTMPAEEAFRDTIYRKGVKAGVPASAYSAIRKSEQASFEPTTRTVDGYKLIQTSPNQYRIAPPAQDEGEDSITPDAFGMLRVQQQGKTRFMRQPEFKFSKQKELEAIEKNPMFQRYGSGDVKAPNKGWQAEIDSMRKRRADLLKELEQERQRFEGGTKVRRLTFDPVKGTYLTNSP